MPEKYIPEKISRNPNDIIELAYISDPMRRYVPKGMLGQLTRNNKLQIRQKLNMRSIQAFPRCRGKVRKFIAAREAEGDFTHSGKDHLCDECRCQRIAGSGTKGNFYGLGPQTGFYGVGYCEWCIRSHNYSPGLMVKIARTMVREMQSYGTAEDHMDSEYGLKVAKIEAGLVRQKEKVREGMSLLSTTLKDMQAKIASEEFTEMTPDGPMPAADKTKAELLLKYAMGISKIGDVDWKQDKDNKVDIEELTKRMPEMLAFIDQLIGKALEMDQAKYVKGEDIETERPIREYMADITIEGMRKIWKEEDMKKGRK